MHTQLIIAYVSLLHSNPGQILNIFQVSFLLSLILKPFLHDGDLTRTGPSARQIWFYQCWYSLLQIGLG